jgi:hypothetical protein
MTAPSLGSATAFINPFLCGLSGIARSSSVSAGEVAWAPNRSVVSDSPVRGVHRAPPIKPCRPARREWPEVPSCSGRIRKMNDYLSKSGTLLSAPRGRSRASRTCWCCSGESFRMVFSLMCPTAAILSAGNGISLAPMEGRVLATDWRLIGARHGGASADLGAQRAMAGHGASPAGPLSSMRYGVIVSPIAPEYCPYRSAV